MSHINNKVIYCWLLFSNEAVRDCNTLNLINTSASIRYLSNINFTTLCLKVLWPSYAFPFSEILTNHQSISQSINLPRNWPITQPPSKIKLPTYGPLCKCLEFCMKSRPFLWIHPSTCQSISQSTDPPISQSIDPPTHQSNGKSIDQPTNQSVNQLIHPSTN